MGDAFEGVEDGGAEVVGGIHFPFRAGTVVRLGIAAVDDWITHSFVRVLDGHFGADAPFAASFSPFFHLSEVSEVFLNRGIAAGAGEAFHALVAHFLLRGVVGVGFADFKNVHAVVVHFLEVVARVTRFVGADAHEGEVFDDGVLEFFLFFRGVCVVEAAD